MYPLYIVRGWIRVPRAFVVSEVRTLTKAVAAFAVALLALALWGSPAWAQAVLSVEKTDTPDPVTVGDVLTYTIVVENTGNADATNVELIDTLPAQTEFISATATSGDCDEPPEGTLDAVECDLNDIANGESATVTIRVRAATTGDINNTATATSLDVPTVTGTDATRTTVVPDLVIRKLDDPDPVTPEDLLLYTLRVTNRGPDTVNDIVVIDDLPLDDVDLVRFQSDDFICRRNAAAQSGLIRCEGSLAEGETGTVEIVVEPEREGTIRNTAEVRAEGSRVDRDTEETTVEADAEETTAEETTAEETTAEETTGEQTTDQKTTDEQTTVIDGQTILIPDELADTTLPATGGPSGIALAAGCALLGVGLIINRIFR
jgi:uncharacterized repeat protein (TIGR01451 family)